MSASPFATGGGGVRLEHRYAATLLASVLTGDPLSELGDRVVPLRVRLQASDISPVDDVVVEGRLTDGQLRRVSIGVRHEPTLTTSDVKSVPLIRSFLRIVTNHWDEVFADRWRVALAAGVSTAGVRETLELAPIAQGVGSAADFRDAVDREAATNQDVRARLTHLDALVAQAVDGDRALAAFDAGELTWRWLFGLRIKQLRLEGVDEADRTAAVSALRHVVADGSAQSADNVFATLAELSGGWASVGAQLSEGLLRRALSGYALNRSTSYGQAWPVLDGLSRRLREGIRPDLSGGQVRLELDRAEERERLIGVITHAGRVGSAVVVTGEPDVGKSALTLRAAEHLVGKDAAVLSLSLRDLPTSVVELERLLGHSPVADVMAGAEVRPVRLLVIDCAESVLEGRRELLRELAAAAMTAGIGVIAVTRTDGATRAKEVLEAAASAGEGSAPPTEHVVSRLTPAERQTLVATFRPLIRLSADAHSDWLVGRPGLVDVLLRAGTISETTELLSESDVFAAVWNGLVRNHEERNPDGISPDDRERAVLAVARRLLNAPARTEPTGAVWAALRSDGVLRSPMNAALAAGDEFATDLVRDFALCRLFLVDGWEPLRVAGAPRWTIRAVRLACQAKLATGDRAAIWPALRRQFDQISDVEGERWAEVPVEALLTLGDAQTAIDQVWDDLTSDGHAGLKTLLRLAQLRYVSSSFGDPFVLAAIVAVTFCSGRELGQHDPHSYRGDVGDTIRRLVLAWLRGMIETRGPDPLRQQVREQILGRDHERYDEFAVEALAMLGPDTDDRTEQWLRGVATADPDRLASAIESVGVAVALSEVRPALLLELTESYYIEQPNPDDGMWTDGIGLEDFGIRHLHHGRASGPPWAAWHYGPFFRLLNTVPADAIGMINRMLDHAAVARVHPRRGQPGGNPDNAGGTLDGFEFDIPGIGPRHFVGDDHVWAWYRGSTVGPYPCMSALLAVERFADHLIDNLNVSPEAIVRLLLRDCHNLAMAGLAVGLLVRHRDKAAGLLDPWLGYPAVWALESARVAREGILHVQRPDSDEVAGRDRRRLPPHDVGAEMTVRALVAGDQPRLDVLGAVADRLLANVRTQVEDGSAAADRIPVAAGWASIFRAENYHTHRNPDGSMLIEYEPPATVTSASSAFNAEMKAGNEGIRLQMTYAADRNIGPDGLPEIDTLIADIEIAQQLAANPPAHGPLHPEDPVTAVAAAAIISHAHGRITIPDHDLQWASDTVLMAATNPRINFMSHESTIYPMSADRSAAKAVPSLSLPRFEHPSLNRDRLNEALLALATSMYDEVRTAFAGGCAPVWTAPCTDVLTPAGACERHAGAWAAVQAGIADCRLGRWNPERQRRLPEPLSPPYADTLPLVPETDLLVNRLATPIACTAAARNTPCISTQAAELLPPLLDAHRRGTNHWIVHGYGGYEDAQRELVSRVLIDLATQDEPEHLVGHLQTFAQNANALQQLLSDLLILFTYDPSVRQALPTVWPLALRTTLDAIDAGADLTGNRNWVDYAVSNLMPHPHIRFGDTDPDGTLARARADWISPEALDGLVDRWIALATFEPKAADAVAQFARTAANGWQASTGLIWLERIIDGEYHEFAGRCWWVTNWLQVLREADMLSPSNLSQWRRIVDGLAAAGDRRAVDLQRLDE